MSENINRQKLIERIRALFNLGDKDRNSSDNEANVAMAKAQELLQKHNLEIADIDIECEQASVQTEVVDEVAWTARKSSMSSWESQLAGVVTLACETGCYILTEKVSHYHSGKIFTIRFYGTPWDVAISKELYLSLHKTIKRLSVRNYPDSLRNQNSYMKGCVSRLYSRVKEQNEFLKSQVQANKKYELMVVNKKDAIDLYKNNIAGLKDKKCRHDNNLAPGAYMKGYHDAEQFDIGTENKLKEGEESKLIN